MYIPKNILKKKLLRQLRESLVWKKLELDILYSIEDLLIPQRFTVKEDDVFRYLSI